MLSLKNIKLSLTLLVLILVYSFCHKDNEVNILELIKPVSLKNCDLKRFGSSYDGGYLICESELAKIESVYSYGIEGRDEFGCEVAKFSQSIVHQYDPFDIRKPKCDGAIAQFNSIGIRKKIY